MQKHEAGNINEQMSFAIASYPIIVIGAGAGGLVIANGAAKAGKKVMLIEKGNWGGDCTNFGCIPSKSLIAAADAAHAIRSAKDLGIDAQVGQILADASLERVRSIVAEVRSHEDLDTLKQNGVDAVEGTASFIDPHTLLITDATGQSQQVYGKQIVIATGSSAFIPPVKGLKESPYLTNETIFSLKKIPKRLAVLGGGPIGSELAQAMQRLGSSVSLIAKDLPLMKEDPEVQTVMMECFRKEGIDVYTDCLPEEVRYSNGEFTLVIQEKLTGKKVEFHADALLVSVGRRPHISSLDLPKAGIAFSEKGIPIDRFCRTNQPHIWAIGDVTGGPLFTHYAENQARTVLTSLLLPFGLKKRLSSQPVPRVTFTDPEVASIGLSEKEALKLYQADKIAIYTVPYSAVDRAMTANRTEGFVKIITKKWSSKILGSTIVGPHAGEMLMQISLAMHAGIPLRKLASIINPYPTYSLAIRKASDMWLTQTILPSIKKMLLRTK